MELHSGHTNFQHSHLGDEKHQMLNLNRRLETYLNRVKLLEEENALLVNEIQTLRHSSHGAWTWRKGLEEELQHARLEVDAAWRDRVYTELEVSKLAEVLRALEQQRHREAQVKVKVMSELEQSRKELEQEEQAQIWLKEKVSQLENEMGHLIRTHEKDVANLEATKTQSRAQMPAVLTQRSNQVTNLQQMGEEYSQRVNMAWQEAEEAYKGQLARLEESLYETRNRITEVDQEKRESQLMLRALEKKIMAAQDIRLHLERTVTQQGQEYDQQVQQLQEHMEGLHAEKVERGQQIDRLLLENQGLTQMKKSLGLEVATYRALLDNQSLQIDISTPDAAFNPRGVKKNNQTQLPAIHKTTSLSSVRVLKGPTVITTTPRSRPPLALTPKISGKPLGEDTIKSAAGESPYPKVLQDGAVENFRPKEVREEVTYADPLSPPNEQDVLREGVEERSNVGAEPPEEKPVVESNVSHHIESGYSSEPPSTEEVHEFTSDSFTPYHVMLKEETFGSINEPDEDLLKIPAENVEMQKTQPPTEEWAEEEPKAKEEEKEETDSETKAVIESDFESRTSSLMSEYEPEEGVFDEVMGLTGDGDILKVQEAETRQELSRSIVGILETDVEDKLYPDGEEMDTWDSVIERKAYPKMDGDVKKNEDKRQHAEPEEDISTREQAASEMQQGDRTKDKEVEDEGQPAALDQAALPDNEDEEEDSQNVSVSWKTELESDSYAQENTLADTRPLIRYQSDDTDGNIQASHMDESESSEGEQEKKIGETVGMWSEGKSNRFGTMEDLCEEVEEEALDEDYELRYTDLESRDVGQTRTASEPATDELSREDSEGHPDEGTQELSKPVKPMSVDSDEEIETDRLVEQELENLATDFYSTHFALRQVSQIEKTLDPQDKTKDQVQIEAGTTTLEYPGEEPEKGELTSSIVIKDQPSESFCFSESSVPPTVEEVQQKDQDAPEKREQWDELNVSLVTHVDVTEDNSGLSDFVSRPDMEESSISVLTVSADKRNLQDVPPSTEVKEVQPVEPSQEHPIGDVQVPSTSEWEVLENPSEDFEITDRKEDELVQGHLHDERSFDVGVEYQPLEISPDSIPNKADIFLVKPSTGLFNTNDNSLHGFFSSGIKSDIWMSSSESGATNQPDYSCNEAVGQSNKNQGFADNMVWGDLENPDVVNWNPRVDIDSSKALAAKKEQQEMRSDVKQMFCRNVEGELVDTEESEVEAESWSSGEETV